MLSEVLVPDDQRALRHEDFPNVHARAEVMLQRTIDEENPLFAFCFADMRLVYKLRLSTLNIDIGRNREPLSLLENRDGGVTFHSVYPSDVVRSMEP